MQKRSNILELTVYAVLWVALFLAPLFSASIQAAHDATSEFAWRDVFFVWRHLAVFLVAFLLHNFLLAPLLVFQRRYALYFSSIAALVAVFIAVQCSQRPAEGMPPHDEVHTALHQDRRQRHEALPATGERPYAGFHPQPDNGQHRPQHGGKPGGGPRGHRPPAFFGEHDIVATIFLVLMLGMNIGVKLFFKQRRDQAEQAETERRNLEQQLEYLKYQINPHFMMNTLNNIHALVDIDPEEAKETIVELSKIMRFVLYEGSKQVVPLKGELTFLENYVRLMWKRVADQVDISLDLPTSVPDREVPPLLLITFVENAFKHGVSYQQESFISISVKADAQHLFFLCRNSKVARPTGTKATGGVGLANARKRLDLIYGQSYTLTIDDGDDAYSVTLDIPLAVDEK